MFSILRGVRNRIQSTSLLGNRVTVTPPVETRRWFLIPSDQYDNNRTPNRFRLRYALVHHWEIGPLLFCTSFAMLIMTIAIFWATRNKVDIVFSRDGGNISRTMDLRHPTAHKMVTINQRYKPWPEMQDVLDKMKAAQKKIYVRAANCDNPAAGK